MFWIQHQIELVPGIGNPETGQANNAGAKVDLWLFSNGRREIMKVEQIVSYYETSGWTDVENWNQSSHSPISPGSFFLHLNMDNKIRNRGSSYMIHRRQDFCRGDLHSTNHRLRNRFPPPLQLLSLTEGMISRLANQIWYIADYLHPNR